VLVGNAVPQCPRPRWRRLVRRAGLGPRHLIDRCRFPRTAAEAITPRKSRVSVAIDDADLREGHMRVLEHGASTRPVLGSSAQTEIRRGLA
jgi:hypothetical protein